MGCIKTVFGLVMASVVLAACQGPAGGSGEAVKAPLAPTGVVVAQKATDPGMIPTVTATGARPEMRISPEITAALVDLTAPDFKTREAAVRKLEVALAQDFQDLVEVQQVLLAAQKTLAKQLTLLTGVGEAEAQARVAGLIEFNYALSRWALDVMALPDAQRAKSLAWGLDPSRVHVVAQAYHRREDQRVVAARELAKMDGEEASWMLGQMVGDIDREVALNAMDALATRPASPQIVDALWNKAMAQTMQQILQTNARARTVTVRGRVLQIYDSNDMLRQSRMADADVAMEVLIALKPPAVTERLNGLLEDAMKGMSTMPNDYRWRVLWPQSGYGNPQTVWRLVETFKPKAAMPFCMAMLSTTSNDGNYGTQAIGAERLRYSSRIETAAIVIKMAGGEIDAFGLKKIMNYGDRYMLTVATDGMAEEGELAKRLQDWWKDQQPKHAKGEAVDPPKPGKKTATPVTTKKAEPAITDN